MDKEQAELLRRVASVVGHELRNPLAVINNSAYFVKTKLASGGAMDPKVEKHLGIVVSEIARADRLIGELLAYSRPVETKTAAAALDAAVEAVLKERPLPENVKLDRKLAAKGVLVPLDKKAFADALGRVLDNALEAMPEGGTLAVATGRGPDGARVEVSDTGPGFAPELLPRLFEPFLTGKPRGLGLGLASARKLLEAQGARIAAENPPGGGALVRIYFPA